MIFSSSDELSVLRLRCTLQHSSREVDPVLRQSNDLFAASARALFAGLQKSYDACIIAKGFLACSSIANLRNECYPTRPSGTAGDSDQCQCCR